MGSLELITDDSVFGEVVDELRSEAVYAIDTEFHRERTYFPKVALVQLAWGDELVLVDPLAVDLAPFAQVLDGDGLAVLHAASQDLEVLWLSCGTVPRRLFDTQIAAGFVGMASPSLAALHEKQLGVRLPKGDRLTDWLRRPLSDDQLDYAASDVRRLIELYEQLSGELSERGRLEWALAECEQLRTRTTHQREPYEAYLRIKEVRQLRGRALAVAREVAAWREKRAAEIDQPVRFVLPDLAVVGVAQRLPTSVRDLRRVRGVDDRHLRGDVAEGLLAAVAVGAADERPRERPPRRSELARELRPAVGLVSAWVGQLARDIQIEASLLATRSDLEALLRGDADARLATGWRAELVGGPIRDLVEGRAALAFDGGGALRLEERSHRPIRP